MAARQSVDLIGTDPRFAHFGGSKLRRFSPRQLAAQQAVALPAPIGDRLDSLTLGTVQLQVGARVTPVHVGATLGEAEIGSLVRSPVVIAPDSIRPICDRYEWADYTYLRPRLSKAVSAKVQTGLRRLAGAMHVNLEPANFDATLFAVAALPENQSETLFSAISAIVGFMLALNAMLITVPRRRQLLSHVRFQGANRTMALQILLFDALIIGVLSCVLGLMLGDGLSIFVFHSTPGYLSFAFPVGNARIVTWQSVLIAVVAGMVAAGVGVLWPLRDTFSRPRERGTAAHRSWAVGRALGGIVGFAVTTVVLVSYPQDSKLGNLTLVVALLCALPFLFDGAVAVFALLQPVLNRPSPRIALTHLRTPTTRIRTLAIVATSAVAVFGVVSIQGAQQNLQHGLDASAHGLDSSTDVWVTPRGNPMRSPRPPSHTQHLQVSGAFQESNASVCIVEASSHGAIASSGFWRPRLDSSQPIPPSELVAGDLTSANARLRGSGWAVVSKALAAERGLQVGTSFTLPSPEPESFRVAALSTNLGWPPGAIILNATDYARAWGNIEPSGLEIQTSPDALGYRCANESCRLCRAHIVAWSRKPISNGSGVTTRWQARVWCDSLRFESWS